MASFKITVNDPCQEKWGSMQADNLGRFCDSCQKSVIDFTHFTDADLIKWLSNNKYKACGRFAPEQLDRFINKGSTFSLQWFKPGMIAASLVALLSLPKLSIAANAKSHPTYQSSDYKQFKSSYINEKVEGAFVVVKGRVIDNDDQSPVVGAQIIIKGTKISTVSRADGYFELKFRKEDFKGKIVLDLRYIGYKSQEVKVNLNKADIIVVKLKMESYILGGLGIIKAPTLFKRVSQFLNG